jgi:hypothetical protein
MINLKKELKSIYEEKFADKIGATFSPFFTRFEDSYNGKTGVLFVGKADNIERRPQTIEKAFDQIHGDYIRQIAETCSGYRSSYVHTLHGLAKELKKRGITCFARTNLYKLSNTNSHAFGSEYDVANFDIFRKELEVLQPKYVILLTSGLETPFLDKLGKRQNVISSIKFSYYKGQRQKTLNCIKFEKMDSIFITALHPERKPNMVNPIMELIDKAESVA